MAHQQPAQPVVVPLLLQRPDPALGLVELGDQPQAALAAVVPHLLLQKRLVEIEARDTVALSLRELLEKTGEQVPRLVALLDEADYLVHLVRNHVPVLVLVRPLPAHLLVHLVRVVVAVRLAPPCSPRRPLSATAAQLTANSRFLHFQQTGSLS